MTSCAAGTLLLDYERLSGLSREANAYREALPFSHAVIDNFLPSNTIRLLLDQYPHDQSLASWNNATHPSKGGGAYVQKEKRNIRDITRMPWAYRQVIWELQSLPTLQALSDLTGIAGLLPDPMLRGGGIHQIGRGGYLKVHADFTLHRDYDLDRRINLLIYLNEDWQDEWGGHLELWDPALAGPPRRVSPIANRCVIFSTTSDSFHGHPHPLKCPEGIYRKSIALYYYTNGRNDQTQSRVFSTDWREV